MLVSIDAVKIQALYSAHGVSFPKPSDWPKVLPSPTEVKPLPTAPAMMLRPAMWCATSGKTAKSKAGLVKEPVATIHAVKGGWAKMASRAASMALTSLRMGALGSGRYFVAPSPLWPGTRQLRGHVRTRFFDLP